MSVPAPFEMRGSLEPVCTDDSCVVPIAEDAQEA